MTTIYLTLLSLVVAWMGLSLLRTAADIAIRRKTNVWTSARPEALGGLLFIADAMVIAAVAGGWI